MDNQNAHHRTTIIILIALIMMILCGIFILVFFIFFSDLLPGHRSTAQTPNTLDAVWQRIQANDKIVVGVSADYPPFSYIGPDFTLQGYDIALMREIGRRIDLPLEVHNMAFDGLTNALILGQIDLAIAAITNTPERDQLIDFSSVYYVGEDAILARNDSSITVVTVRDLAKYPIGVQTGTAYSNWVKTTLIDPGYMQSQDLHTFETYDEGIDALTSTDPQIDLFISDLLPATETTKTKPVKIIVQGLNPQSYAIALPQGAYTLKNKLDQTLEDMEKDGTLAKLAQQYLNLGAILPLPTPLPTQIPVTPSACIDGMQFVKDLTFADSNMTTPPTVSAGSLIQKGWQIKNTGSCTWNNTYVLSYSDSVPEEAAVGGNPVAIQGLVSPGQTYDIYVTFTAPSQPGKYQSFWNMRSPAGTSFGDRIWAGFEVIGQATPTSTPTPALQPPVVLSFTVHPVQIQLGQCVSLSWQYTGQQITSSQILRNGAVIQSNLPMTSSLVDCPPQMGQSQYQLVIDSSGLGSAVANQAVTVFSPVVPTFAPSPTPAHSPVTLNFDADDQSISVGQCTNLSWSFGGAPIKQSQIYREGTIIASNLSSTGTLEECPPEAGQIQYILRIVASNSTEAQESEFISVRNPKPSQPLITSFSADPTQISLGNCANLSWTIQAEGSNKTSLTRNGQQLASGLSYSGSFRDCPNNRSLVGELVYNLQISGTNGADSKSVTVTLTSALSSFLQFLFNIQF